MYSAADFHFHFQRDGSLWWRCGFLVMLCLPQTLFAIPVTWSSQHCLQGSNQNRVAFPLRLRGGFVRNLRSAFQRSRLPRDCLLLLADSGMQEKDLPKDIVIALESGRAGKQYLKSYLSLLQQGRHILFFAGISPVFRNRLCQDHRFFQVLTAELTIG